MKFLEGGSPAWKCGWNNWGARWDCKRPVDNVSCSTESSTGSLYWAGLDGRVVHWTRSLCSIWSRESVSWLPKTHANLSLAPHRLLKAMTVQ